MDSNEGLPSMDLSLDPYNSETPKALVARSYLILTGTWTTASNSVVSLFNPVSLLLAKVFPISGGASFNFARWRSITLRVTISSTSYNKGMLMMVYQPQPWQAPNWTFVALTQCPSTLIDASSDTVVEFIVPYVYRDARFDLNAACQPFGNIAMIVIDPLANDLDPGATCTVNFDIEAMFNDFNYSGQSVGNVLAALIAPVSNTTYGGTSVWWQNAQGTTKEATKKSSKGVISGVAEAVSTIAASLTKVPLIGDIAATTATAAHVIGSVAQWFGMSKPVSVEATMPTRPTFYTDSASLHGLINGTVISTSQDMIVSADPDLVHSQGDELDLMALAKRPVLFHNATYTTSQASGTLILSFPVTPNQFGGTNSWGKSGTHLGYASSFFRLWRGSINYRFVFPSTNYRKCRLALTWSPKFLAAYTENVHQQIFTVNGSTTLDFAVPYNHPAFALPLTIPTDGTSNNGSGNGYVQLWILSPLSTANNTEARSATVLVFSAAGEDLQFFGFIPPINPDTLVAVAPLAFLSTATSVLPRAQGAISTASGARYTGVVAEDDVMSLREIAHRFTEYDTASMEPGSLFTLDILDPLNSDLVAYVTQKFVFWRGSVNWKIIGQPGSTARFIVSRGGCIESGSVYGDNNLNPYLEFSTPFISRFGVYTTPKSSALASECDVYQLHSDGTSDVVIHRSLGDDFSAGVVLPSPILQALP